jgi:hypothetical protein
MAGLLAVGCLNEETYIYQSCPQLEEGLIGAYQPGSNCMIEIGRKPTRGTLLNANSCLNESPTLIELSTMPPKEATPLRIQIRKLYGNWKGKREITKRNRHRSG